MTERTEAKATLNAMFKRTIPPALILKIIDSFVDDDPFNLSGWYDHIVPDPLPPDVPGGPEIYPPEYDEQRDPTNEEKAELFNKTIRRIVLRTVKRKAETIQAEVDKHTAHANRKAAGDSAVEGLNFDILSGGLIMSVATSNSLSSNKSNNNNVWNKGMIELVAQIWGDKKVPIIWVILLLFGAFTMHEWADLHYMPFTVAEANDFALEKKIDENNIKLTAKIQANTDQMTGFIAGYDIDENRKAIELVKDQMFDLKQSEISTGTSVMIDERRDSLVRKLEILNEDRTCLLDDGEHCT